MKTLKTLAKYVLQTVQRKGAMTVRAIVKAYRRTKAGRKSTSSDAVLASKARKTLQASASIASTSAGSLIAMEVYIFAGYGWS